MTKQQAQSWLNKLVTHSRVTAFLGWAATVWAALEAQGQLAWPLTQAQWVTIVGVTLAWLGRSGLAPAKQGDA